VNKDYSFSRFVLVNRVALPVFLLVSLSGLLFGVFLAETQTSLVHICFSELFVRPSAILLLLTILMPVAAFCLILRKQLQVLLYLIAFFWFVCHGFCGMLLYMTIGEGAWLLRCLLMFSSNAVSVFICWLFARHCEKVQLSFVRDVRLVSFLSVVVFILDIFLISPFLSHLLMYF